MENLNKYDIEWAMKPIWQGNTIYHESLLMVENAAGEIFAPLLYYPDTILSVCDSTLGITYTEKEDFELRDGCLWRTPNSRMPYLTYQQFYCPNEEDDLVMNLDSGGHMRIVCAPYMQQGIIYVTYTHEDSWRWRIPTFKGDLLPRTYDKLQKSEPLTVLFYGDSVTSGDDVTCQTNVPPYTPLWTEMFVANLERRYGSKVTMIDTALGGSDTAWGLKNLQTHVIDYKPDLAVIGFGNNDRMDPAGYRKQIETILTRVRDACPDTEFILVDPMTPNRFISQKNGYRWYVLQDRYAEQHKKLEGPDVAVMEIMQVHLDLQNVKRFWDMTANNVNHPNDFLYRVLAQVCSAILIPADKL